LALCSLPLGESDRELNKKHMSFDYHETLEKADINISTSGDNTIIAAPDTGKYIAIDFIQFLPTSAVTVQFKDGSTNYGGPLPLDAKQALTTENAMKNEHGVFTMSDNSAFVINLSSGVQVGGIVRYRIINK
jgi:hypothetical protein